MLEVLVKRCLSLRMLDHDDVRRTDWQHAFEADTKLVDGQLLGHGELGINYVCHWNVRCKDRYNTDMTVVIALLYCK